MLVWVQVPSPAVRNPLIFKGIFLMYKYKVIKKVINRVIRYKFKLKNI